ncbi:glycoside hydrolase family 18 protein [Roseateles paludis]|jgi:chitinase|uniref:chitinase n=1 Tax=Roseateles paludis TaxID=3145238 RepID=A0ABV0FXR2_9BURK
MKSLLATLLLTASAAHAQVVGVYVLNERPTTHVEQLKPGRVTHVLYAFLRLCGPGQLKDDAKACEGRPAFSVAPNEAHDRFAKALADLKARDPKVTVLASVGGWGGSDPFFHLAATPTGRAAFVQGALDFLRKYPAFDGIDIDWEHPGSNGSANGVPLGSREDGEHYVALLQDLRAALDAHGKASGRRMLVTTAINPSREQMARQPMGQAARALDLIFLMTYDYYGNWGDRAGHHAAVQPTPGRDDGFAAGIANLRAQGVPAAKLVGGVAMYARGFEGVQADGRYTKPYPAPLGEATFKELASLPGLKPQFDAQTQAWALVGDGGRFVGYDDPRAVRAKRLLAAREGLAGLFAWELSQDDGRILDAMQPAAK